MLRHLKEAFGQIIGGRVCEICGRSLPDHLVAFCPGCLSQLPRTNLHFGLPNMVSDIASNAVAPTLVASAWTFYNPTGAAAGIIQRGKYGNRPLYMRTLGRIYASELMADIPGLMNRLDVILPVPMHAGKELHRGYNQAEEFAKGLSAVTGIPVGDNLRAKRRKDTQTHRNRDERRRNVEGVFAVDNPEELEGLNVVVADDVITTGATMAEAILAIGRSEARPASISILAIAFRH